MTAIPSQTLVDALSAGNVVAVVGSGLSLPAGAPSWIELLTGLALEADETQPREVQKTAIALDAIQKGRFLDAASLLKSVLGADWSSAIVRQMNSRRHAAPNEEALARALKGAQGESLFEKSGPRQGRALSPTLIQHLFMQLGFRAVVTTNYDLLLEEATCHPVVSLPWSSSALNERLQGGIKILLKAHGDVNVPADIILARDDYGRVLSCVPFRRALESLFATAYPLWVGYGHNDPDLDLLLDQMHGQFGIRGGFAIAKHDDLLEQRFKSRSIVPTWLDDWGQLGPTIEYLAENTGCKLVIRIFMDIPWSGQERADKVAREAMRVFNKALKGEVITAYRTYRGSIVVIYSVEPGAIAEMKDRLVHGDSALLSIVKSFSIKSIEDLGSSWQIPSSTAPDRATRGSQRPSISRGSTSPWPVQPHSRGALTQEEYALMAAHEHLVHPEVEAAIRKAPWARPYRDDLYQEGLQGLIRAILSPRRDSMRPLSPFAQMSIRSAIRDSDAYTRGMNRRNMALVMHAQDLLFARGLVRPSVQEIAEETANLPGGPLAANQVQETFQSLAVAGPELIEALVEERREPAATPGRPLARRDWTETWMSVIVEMARASSLDHDASYLLACDVLGMENADIARNLGIKEGALRTRKTRLYDQLLSWLGLELHNAGADPEDAGVLLGHLRQTPGKSVSAEQQAQRLASLARLLRGRVAAGSSPRWLLELVQMVLVFVEEAGGQ